MAILLVVVVTILLAGAFTRLGADMLVANDDAAQTAAFTLAETGLERFITERPTLVGTSAEPTDVPELVKIALTGGYAEVELRRVRARTATSAALFVVRSRGVSTAHPAPNTPPASHTVAQYAFWFYGKPVPAAITDLAGLLKNGNSGGIIGTDACLTGLGGAKAGAAVPNGMIDPKTKLTAIGSPPALEMGSLSQALASVDIDWVRLMAGTSITPDVTIPGGSWPASFPANSWPVIRVGTQPTDEFVLPTSGRGLLIVAGNLTISGGFTWDGLILAGGTLKTTGNNNVNGAIVTGLAGKIPGYTVPTNDAIKGNVTVTYNSCHVLAAQQKIARLIPYSNAWTNSWPEP